MENKIKRGIHQKKRKILGHILPLEGPLSVVIDLSEACNLKCNYCFRAYPERADNSFVWKNNFMEWPIFKKAILQLQEFPEAPKKIGLSGHGEPLLNKTLPEMVVWAKKIFPETVFEIHTNAVLLTPSYAKKLAKSGIDKVNVSLQGVTSKAYEKVCKVNIDYNQFVEGIRTLYVHRENTQINVQIVDVALKEGDEKILYEIFSPLCDKIAVETAVPIWEEIQFKKGEKTFATTNKYGREVPFQKSCSLPFYMLFISPDGDVYPCTQPKNQFSYGNLSNMTLYEMWNGQKRKAYLVEHLKFGREAMETCQRCYVAQNAIMSWEDSLNGYQEEILKRLGAK